MTIGSFTTTRPKVGTVDNLGPHFIYWWHVPSHSQIKIGYGYDPRERMTEYAERYGFEADQASLQYREMRSERAAKYAEMKLHEALPEFDLIILGWEAKIGRGQSKELFDMGASTYESVSWLIGELLTEIIAVMPTDAELIAAEMSADAVRRAQHFEREKRRDARLDDDIPF